MLKKFEKHIEKWRWQENKTPLLIACSGGLDSVTLVHLCQQLNLEFAIAHCNFNLRGLESDADEVLVRLLGEKLHKRTFIKSFDTKKITEQIGGSIQMVARELRYDWFDELMEKYGYKALLTAHQSNDSLETFLINLSRGTGLAGLTGIPEHNGAIRRPLLPFSRGEIWNYAKSEGLEWREDSSNTDTKYLRNKIRHELVPKLNELHPTFLQNFENTLNRLTVSERLLHHYKIQLQEELFKIEDDIISIEIEKLKKHKPDQNWMYFLFSDYGFTQWADALALLNAESGKEIRSQTHRLLKDRNHLLLRELKSIQDAIFFIGEEDASIEEPLSLEFKSTTGIKELGADIIYVDYNKINFPLVLRKWKEGDWFVPFGMSGRKKVAKLLKDEKLDVFAKENIWVLCNKDEIIWVVGKRSDNRFKVDKDTKKVLKITLKGN
ncbi:tRNA(Ile)-lysidine synthase [Croceivirga lutea]|uniref:tRNA lysidine(34) synthetase TilS n=1 Tax=Croceivirga lutea TaxID=1775167 RepID=UPI0016395D68|nr:tRNA lysidine(34) synthetase TilS [Croceivirga lutea]GGG46306.1 tRNA(Ile)-lysidine synthase [Croceivirga lutea]